MTFDIVLIEKLPGDGILTKELQTMADMFDETDELIPIEIDSLSDASSAMGFITTDAESIIYGGRPDDFKEFIGSILADVNLERKDHIYEYAKQKIWLAQNV